MLGHTSAVALFAVTTAEGETELWRTDGTAAGTVAVSPMPTVGLFEYDDTDEVTRSVVGTLGETIFFSGCTPDLGCELWAIATSTPTTTTTTTSTSTSTTTTTTIPVCGDGVTNQPSEECDALDDAACPGACRPHCTCGTALLLGTIEADASVREKEPDQNFGADRELSIDADTPKQTFIRLQVNGLGAQTLVGAILRLQVDNDTSAQSDSGGRIQTMTDCGWDELTMTWNTRPLIDGVLLDEVGAVVQGDVVAFNVTNAIVGDGTYCFGLDSPSSNSAKYNSKEAATGGPVFEITVQVPGVCGDDEVNQPSEEFDWIDDAACPGNCEPDCTCFLGRPATTSTSTTSTTTTTTLPGQCTNKPNGSRCDDGNACTSDDGCMEGECVGGAPTNCDARDPCTDDACDPSIGCISSPNSANCNEGAEGENPDDDLGDTDNDGVVNYLDRCAGTPAGDLVGGDGCSTCDCEKTPDGSQWSSRRAYGRCIKSEVKRRRVTTLLTRKEMKAALKRANKSTCGTGDLTRCCLYPSLDKAREPNVGRCRIMPWRRCAKKIRRHGRAEDLGPGSCLPNPCTY